jgi:hypothetical protein
VIRRLAVLVVAIASVAVVAACTMPPAAGPSVVPVMPIAVPLTTQHPVTVLDDGDGAELCLGVVLTSLPPQCGGLKLLGWDWQQHDGEYTEQSGVRWGEFIVSGGYDAEADAFTPTHVVSGEGYEWPAQAPMDFSAVERTQAELSAIQAALPTEGVLLSGIDTVNGTVELRVVYDDGTLQAELDAAHGPGTVRVTSALVPAS